MKVILRQTLPKVGKEGQVVNVADGFARNFLFPRGLASTATKSAIAELERKQAKVADELEKTKAGASALAEKIHGQTIRVIGKAGKGSVKLFGAITDEDIVAGIKSTLKVDIEKRMVALLHPIKRLGVYNVMIDLHPKVDATIKLEVADESGWLGVETAEEAKKEVAEAPVEQEAVAEPVAETAPEAIDTQPETE